MLAFSLKLEIRLLLTNNGGIIGVFLLLTKVFIMDQYVLLEVKCFAMDQYVLLEFFFSINALIWLLNQGEGKVLVITDYVLIWNEIMKNIVHGIVEEI